MAFPILGTPRPQFSDSSGVLASGTITILNPADDTLATYYPTADDADAGTNGATGDITLNANGYTPDGLFGVNNGTYKIVVKNSMGVTIWTEDDIHMSGDASRIVYNHGATGAEDQTVEAKLQKVINVFDFMTATEKADVESRLGNVDVTQAIEDAIAELASDGGGKLHFPAGVYLVDNQDAPAASWDNDAAIWITTNNIYLEGAGVGATKLKLKNSADCHVIKFGQRVGTAIAITNGGVSGMEIDGNRANQSAPTVTDDHWQGIDVSSDATRIHLEDLYIHDCQYYAIGFQNASFSYCVVENVVIGNTGADGIDWKDEDADNTGNMINNVSVTNHGLSSVLSDEAGIDIRGGVAVSNVTVNSFGATAGLTGIRLQYPTSDADLAEPATLTNFRIDGGDQASTVGLRISQRFAKVSNGHITDVSIGVRVTQRECSLNNVMVTSCTDGFEFESSAQASDGDRCTITGCISRSNSGKGFEFIDVSGNIVQGCLSYQNDTGMVLDANTDSHIVSGCIITGNTTAQITNSGTSNVIHHVNGYKTQNSGTGTINSGSTSAVISHGLAITPTLGNIHIIGGENPTNDVGTIWVSTITSTQFTVNVEADPGASNWDFGWAVV